MRLSDPRILHTLGLYLLPALVASVGWGVGAAMLAAFVMAMLGIVLQGVAMALFFVSVVTIQFDGLPPQRIPAATGISNFLRITAAAFSTPIATTMWEDRADLHQSRLAEATSACDPRLQQALASLHDKGLNDQQSLGVLTRGLVEQAYMLSSLDYFWIPAWIALSLAAVVWATRRPRIASGIPAAVE